MQTRGILTKLRLVLAVWVRTEGFQRLEEAALPELFPRMYSRTKIKILQWNFYLPSLLDGYLNHFNEQLILLTLHIIHKETVS